MSEDTCRDARVVAHEHLVHGDHRLLAAPRVDAVPHQHKVLCKKKRKKGNITFEIMLSFQIMLAGARNINFPTHFHNQFSNWAKNSFSSSSFAMNV